MPHPTYTHVADVYRLTRTGNRDAYGDDPVIEGLDISVVPAGTDIMAVYGGGETFALFEIYTGEKVTLKNGDKIVSGSQSWIVKGVPAQIDNHLMAYTMVIGQEAV